MADADITPIAYFRAIVTTEISEGWEGANYGISPAPGIDTQAVFRYREEAQQYADMLNDEFEGNPIYEDSCFDAIFWDAYDTTVIREDSVENTAIWTDSQGIHIQTKGADMATLSDSAARKLIEKLETFIDSKEVGEG